MPITRDHIWLDICTSRRWPRWLIPFIFWGIYWERGKHWWIRTPLFTLAHFRRALQQQHDGYFTGYSASVPGYEGRLRYFGKWEIS